MRQGGMLPGDVLILTKGLGTGTLMAAAMRGKAKVTRREGGGSCQGGEVADACRWWSVVQGRWVEGALTSMRQSSQVCGR